MRPRPRQARGHWMPVEATGLAQTRTSSWSSWRPTTPWRDRAPVTPWARRSATAAPKPLLRARCASTGPRIRRCPRATRRSAPSACRRCRLRVWTCVPSMSPRRTCRERLGRLQGSHLGMDRAHVTAGEAADQGAAQSHASAGLSAEAARGAGWSGGRWSRVGDRCVGVRVVGVALAVGRGGLACVGAALVAVAREEVLRVVRVACQDGGIS